MEIEIIYKKLNEIQSSIKNRTPFLTVPEAANYCKISISKLRKLISDQNIPYQRIDGKIIFHIRKLELWILNNAEKTSFTKADRKVLDILK